MDDANSGETLLPVKTPIVCEWSSFDITAPRRTTELQELVPPLRPQHNCALPTEWEDKSLFLTPVSVISILAMGNDQTQ